VTPIEQILQDLNQKYRFIASVLVRADGKFLARVGDPKEPNWNDPYNVFFRDAETIANTFAFLELRKPPQSMRQGTRSVLLLKPSDDVVLGLVQDDERGVLEMYELRKEIAADVKERFSGVEL
jgi:hypothetical protein